MAKDANKKPKSRDEDVDELEDEASAAPEEDDGEEDEDADDEDADEGADEGADDEGADDEGADADEAGEEAEDEAQPASAASKGTSAKAPAARSRPMPRRRRKRGNPTRNIILFVALVGGLALAFAALGNSRSAGGGPSPSPKWKEGQVVDVEITLVTTDHNNLACAMADEIDGRYCAFTERNKATTKPSDPRKVDKVLQPYTTIDRVQFMAAGLWMQPELQAKLEKENWDRPSPRFSVRCKFHVQGKSKNAYVQWKAGEAWYPASNWYAGFVDNCHIVQ